MEPLHKVSVVGFIMEAIKDESPALSALYRDTVQRQREDEEAARRILFGEYPSERRED